MSTDRPIDQFEFAVRTHERLKSAGLTTVGEVCAKTEKELLAVVEDPRSLREIKEIFADMGLSLKQ